LVVEIEIPLDLFPSGLSFLSMIIIIALSLFGVYFCYNIFLWLQNLYKFRAYRGPFPLPFLGNLHDPEAITMIRYFSSMKRKYGSIFTFWTFNTPFLIITDPSAVRQILTDTKSFPKGEAYTVGFAYVFGQGLVTSDSDKHRVDRARFSKYFVRTNIALYMDILNGKTKDMIKEINAKHPEASFVHDMEHVFAPLAFRIFSSFCTGKDLYEGRRDQENKLCKHVSNASYMVAVSLFLKLPQWRHVFPWTKVLDKMLDTMNPEIEKVIADRRKEMADGTWTGREDCVSQMIQDNLSEKDISEHMITLLSAGHDTTAFFSAYIVYQLALYPDVQEKLRQEINGILGDKEDPDADDLKEMVYLRKVMLETLRCYAIIPSLVRYSVTDFEFKDLKLTIPKGTDLLIPMSILNRDETIWERPGEFDPERFEGSETSIAKKGFFPFGYGSRVCIGNTLAQMEVGAFMCHLLRAYRFEVDPTFKIKITSGISLTTSNGIRVRLTKL
jgi:cytochrome P450